MKGGSLPPTFVCLGEEQLALVLRLARDRRERLGDTVRLVIDRGLAAIAREAKLHDELEAEWFAYLVENSPDDLDQHQERVLELTPLVDGLWIDEEEFGSRLPQLNVPKLIRVWPALNRVAAGESLKPLLG